MTPREEAISALATLDPGMAREDWVRIAFAFKDAGGALEDWIAWCEGGANFNAADAASTYRNAKPRAGGVTSATLFMRARDAGWRPENNGAAVALAPRPAPQPKREPEPEPTDPLPVWEACQPVQVHPYLSRKAIRAHGARVTVAGMLAVPYFNRDAKLQTVQFISSDGTKRFLAGARQKGSCAQFGNVRGAPVVVVAEGFATAATIHEATGYAAMASGSRGTMPDAAQMAREFALGARVVIAADRGDLSTPVTAARAVAGFLAVPGPDDAEDGFDFNDWRARGATDAEIKARIDQAPPLFPAGDDAPAPAPPATRAPAAKRTNAPAPRERSAPEGYLLDARGNVAANLSNMARFLASGSVGDIRLDTFTGAITWDGLPVTEEGYGAIACAVQGASSALGWLPFLRVSIPATMDAVAQAAAAHAFNSSVDWLDTLPPWDGTERCASFFVDVCDCPATDYVLGVGRYFWCAIASRMVRPGTKADATVVLVGAQGIGKSTLAQIIGAERYGEASLVDVGSRDWCANLRGKVLVEISEMSGHSRAELELVKAVLSRQVDEYRPAYARVARSVPRGCVFMASTNEPDFLLDTSGNRRWLPVDCGGAFALDVARANRAQLFAEAYAGVRAGLPEGWHVVPDAADQQARHLARDPWLDVLDDKLRDLSGALPPRIVTAAIYSALNVPTERQTGGGTGRRVAAAMRVLGYTSSRWRAGGRLVHGFELAQPDTLERSP